MEEDPRDFIFNQIWHVFEKTSIETPTDAGPAVIQGQTTDGRSYVIAFTDRYLAQEFLEKRNDPSWVAVEMQSMAHWIEYLEYLHETGHEYLGIDPKEGGQFTLRPIPGLIAELKEQEQ